MKLSRFCAFSRCLLGVASVTTLTFQASAAPFFWKSSSTSGDWNTGSNWSITNLASGTSPATGPTSHTAVTGDIATFTVNSPANGAQTVNLQGGTKSALGLVTAAQTTTTSILSGGTPGSVLNIGEGGIDHRAGGLTIGSATPAQAVNITLMDIQDWNGSAAGTGAVSLIVHNNITNGIGDSDLTLTGINSGSIINGNILAGAAVGELNVVKSGTGTWTLAGTASTYNGRLIVNEGTMRLTNRGAVLSRIYVGGNGKLSLRVGGASGFNAQQVDEVRTVTQFRDSVFALDTTNGSFTYDSQFANGVLLANLKFDIEKLGGNTLTLSGNNSGFPAPYGTTITEGTLALTVPNAAPGHITIGANGTLAVVAGGAGFTAPEIETLLTPAKTTFVGTGSFGISTVNGDVVYPAVLSGGIRFNKTAVNTLVLTADNTYTGATVVSAGSLSIPRIPNGGLASPLGASSSDAANLVLAGGRLAYTGPTATTDRLFSMSTSGAIEASGTGALTLGTGTITHSGTINARTLTLSGINQGLNTIPAVLGNSGTGTNLTSVTKTGYGNWTFTGANTFTGIARGRGGNLTFDYAGADALAGTVLIQAGTVELKAATGGTTDTMPVLQVGEAHNGLGTFKLTGGVNLTVTKFDGSNQTQRHNLIDVSGNGNSINVTELNSSTVATNKHLVAMADGLLINNASTLGNARANIVLRAADGTYGFAAFAPGTTTGLLQKLSFAGPSVLTPGATPVTINSSATNYYLGTGSYTSAASPNFSTMTLDSVSGPVNFALGAAHSFNPSSSGKAILATGANDVSITGGGTKVLSQPTWFHNYLEPSVTLNISSNIGKGAYFLIGGTGYTNYSGIGLGQRSEAEGGDTQFVQDGGVFRVTTDQDLTLATSGGVLRVSDGIFEIGADLNGAAAGDLTRVSDGTFRLLGSAGFSAHTATPGGTRVASFSNPLPLVWGSADFLVNAADTANPDGDYAFRFGSPRSNATIRFTNDINLNGRYRAVEVADGDPVNGAETDAILSGVLSGSAISGLVKTGPGTLALTGLNTYGGETRVLEGVLKIQTGSVPAASRLVIQGAGKVSVSGNVGVQSVVINGVEQGPGVVTAPGYITGGGALYVGAAPAGMTYAQWVTNKALQPAESAELFDADFDGLLNLLEYGLGTEPKTPNGSPLTHNPGNSVFRFNRATDRTDITTIIESSETLTGVWSTVATSNGIGAFVLNAGVTGVAIDESTPGTVIVTTSGTVPTKKFHRVRVTK